jgi:hypothetical protein
MSPMATLASGPPKKHLAHFYSKIKNQNKKIKIPFFFDALFKSLKGKLAKFDNTLSFHGPSKFVRIYFAHPVLSIY